MPDDWEELIQERLIVPFVMSPLHDKDEAQEGKGWNGTPFKKPHYHNMVMFTNVKSYKQVSDLVSCLGGTVAVSQVHSTQSMIRYFVHADHKKKAQYDKADIRAYNGADIDNLFEKNDKEIYKLLSDIIDFIEDNSITELIDLSNYARKEMLSEWFPLITGKYCFYISKVLDSNRGKLPQQAKNK